MDPPVPPPLPLKDVSDGTPPLIPPISKLDDMNHNVTSDNNNNNNNNQNNNTSSVTKAAADIREPSEEEQKIFMAAQALGQLRNSSSTPPDIINPDTNTNTNTNTTADSTLLDKVVAHPLISQSINYMLEKTIQSASTHIKETNSNHSEISGSSIPPIVKVPSSQLSTNHPDTSPDNSVSHTTLPPLNMIMNMTSHPAVHSGTAHHVPTSMVTSPLMPNHSRSSSISSMQSRKRFNDANSQEDDSTDDEDDDEKFKKPRLSASSSTNSIISMSNSPPSTLGHNPSTYQSRLPHNYHNPLQRLNSSQFLRQQSVVSQRSLHDIKEIGIINLNIESRKRLNMLINFLKIGNRQISDRIEHLMRLVELQREHEEFSKNQQQANQEEFFDASEDLPNAQTLTAVSSNSSINNEKLYESSSSLASSKTATPDLTPGDESEHETDFQPMNKTKSTMGEIPIQQIKDDIIGTVKKIVNVVSKVSANSLPEPARSNVREALLKLPSNWAFALAGEDFKDSNDDGEIKEDEDMDDEDKDQKQEVEEKSKNTKNHSLAQKLLSNLFRYNKYIRDTYYNRTQSQSLPTSSSSSSSIATTTTSSTPLSYFFPNENESTADSNKSWSWLTTTIESQLNYDMNKNGRILVLAQESLDMINKVIRFCNDSLDKADQWNQNKTTQQQVNLLNKLENLNYTSNTPSLLSTSTTDSSVSVYTDDTNTSNTTENESVDSNSTLQ